MRRVTGFKGFFSSSTISLVAVSVVKLELASIPQITLALGAFECGEELEKSTSSSLVVVSEPLLSTCICLLIEQLTVNL